MPSGENTTRYLEVERKFDVDDSTAVPSFAGIATAAESSSQALDAVYFDTPAHDLAARKITLRRRTGGADSGWHLKLPAGPDARTEVRAPLGTAGDEVPPELLDVVLAVVRDRPVAPVVRISTSRDVQPLRGADGSVQAEFCDDRVTASTIGAPDPKHWREWELELTDAGGDPGLLDRLSARLLETGAVGSAPPARIYPDPIHRAVAEQVDQLLVWDRAVRADADDAVHQLRVTIRKIRSLVAADTLGLSDGARISDELRWLADLLGTARDAEVLAQRYRRALDRLPPRLVRGPAEERLVDAAAQRYRDGWRRSLAAMRSPRYFRLLDRLDELVAEQGHPVPGAPQATQTIDAAYRRVSKAERAAARVTDDASRDRALHRIRKAAKRLRYTAAATGAPEVAAAV